MVLKYYVLTSSKIEGLTRHTSEQYSNIPKDQMVVIINTLDLAYSHQAQEYCILNNIEHYVTESNGTPGKGKNSLLDKFLESDYDYMVQIDGDDYLTPHGVWLYNHLAQTESPPDVVCLTEQVSLTHKPLHIPTFKKEHGRLPEFDDLSIEATRPFYTDYAYLDDYNIDRMSDAAKSIINYWVEQKKYSEPNETHCRITWYSRKAAQCRFREDIHIGEDTIHYFLMKNLHVNGQLTFMSNTESPPTYIYDQSVPGIVHSHSQRGDDLSWIGKYLNVLYDMKSKGQLHGNDTVVLPKLSIEYPYGYEPNVLGLIGSKMHKVIDGESTVHIGYPANGTAQGLINKYRGYCHKI